MRDESDPFAPIDDRETIDLFPEHRASRSESHLHGSVPLQDLNSRLSSLVERGMIEWNDPKEWEAALYELMRGLVKDFAQAPRQIIFGRDEGNGGGLR